MILEMFVSKLYFESPTEWCILCMIVKRHRLKLKASDQDSVWLFGSENVLHSDMQVPPINMYREQIYCQVTFVVITEVNMVEVTCECYVAHTREV